MIEILNLILACHFSGKIFTKLIPNRTAPAMATFYSEIVSTVKVTPTIVHVDKGAENLGEFKQQVIDSGAEYVNSATRSPQSNGAVERVNGILKPDISRILREQGHSTTVNTITYATALASATATHNSRPNTVTGYKPDELFNVGLIGNPSYFESNSRNFSLADLEKCREYIDNVLTSKAKRSELDRKSRQKSVPADKAIKVGDDVWVKEKNPKNKHQKQRKYRARIIERLANGRVKVIFTTDDGGPNNEKRDAQPSRTYRIGEVAHVFSSKQADAGTKSSNTNTGGDNEPTATNGSESGATAAGTESGDNEPTATNGSEPGAGTESGATAADDEPATQVVSRRNRKRRRPPTVSNEVQNGPPTKVSRPNPVKIIDKSGEVVGSGTLGEWINQGEVAWVKVCCWFIEEHQWKGMYDVGDVASLHIDEFALM
jgi:hypothetical protein